MSYTINVIFPKVSFIAKQKFKIGNKVIQETYCVSGKSKF